MKIMPGCCEVPLTTSQYSSPPLIGIYARNGMCLSAASSAIGEDGRIVPIQHTVQQGLGSRLIHIALCCGIVEHAIERKCLVLHPLSLWSGGVPCEAMHGVVIWGVEDSEVGLATPPCDTGGMFLTSTSRPEL